MQITWRYFRLTWVTFGIKITVSVELRKIDVERILIPLNSKLRNQHAKQTFLAYFFRRSVQRLKGNRYSIQRDLLRKAEAWRDSNDTNDGCFAAEVRKIRAPESSGLRAVPEILCGLGDSPRDPLRAEWFWIEIFSGLLSHFSFLLSVRGGFYDHDASSGFGLWTKTLRGQLLSLEY